MNFTEQDLDDLMKNPGMKAANPGLLKGGPEVAPISAFSGSKQGGSPTQDGRRQSGPDNLVFEDTEALVSKFIEAIRQDGRASVSFFQRRFHLGYIRAREIADILVARGIIGKSSGGAEPALILNLPPESTPECPVPLASAPICPPKPKKGVLDVERKIQDEIASYLRLHELPFIRPRMDRKSTIAKGWPDFTIFRGEKFLMIEVKILGNGLSPDQVKMHVEISKTCLVPAVCFSADEAIRLVKDYFQL